ncbi:unnamed protein product, partial [Ixodes hexagonus]
LIENFTCYDFHQAVCNENNFLTSEWTEPSLWPYRYSSLEHIYETIQTFIDGECRNGLRKTTHSLQLRKLPHNDEVVERRREHAATKEHELIYSLVKTRHLLPSRRKLYHYIGREFHELAEAMSAVSRNFR